jgi:aromatic-amino-acid transaminase
MEQGLVLDEAPLLLDRLEAQPADPLIALIGLFRADPRPEKIDVGVGVFRDPAGNTPILKSVKEA